MLCTCRAIARDPEWFPDPDEFRPERYIDANGKLDARKGDPMDFAFGFGRRFAFSALLSGPAIHRAHASVLT